MAGGVGAVRHGGPRVAIQLFTENLSGRVNVDKASTFTPSRG